MRAFLFCASLTACVVALQACDDSPAPAAASSTVAASVPVVKSDTDYGVPWSKGVEYGALTDARDGQTYRTVRIGAQTWMAQNLNYRVDSSWSYGNSEDSAAKYGRFYAWTTAVGLPDSCSRWSCATLLPAVVRGICPAGWHVPRSWEWKVLLDTVKKDPRTVYGKESFALKALSGWYDAVQPQQDFFGFRGLAAGYRQCGTYTFTDITWTAVWWSASEDTVYDKVDRVLTPYLSAFGNSIPTSNYQKISAYSVRCLQD